MKSTSSIMSHLTHAYAYRYEPEQRGRMMILWWRALLVCFGVAVVSMALCGYATFEHVLLPEVDAVPHADMSRVIFERSMLAHILDMFDARATRYDEIKAMSVIADPSK